MTTEVQWLKTLIKLINVTFSNWWLHNCLITRNFMAVIKLIYPHPVFLRFFEHNDDLGIILSYKIRIIILTKKLWKIVKSNHFNSSTLTVRHEVIFREMPSLRKDSFKFILRSGIIFILEPFKEYLWFLSLLKDYLQNFPNHIDIQKSG